MGTPRLVCWGVLLVCAAGPALAGTLYRCKAYTGGLFWSRHHCQAHGALIERVAPVPDGLPFATQVRLAEQASGTSAATASQQRKAEQVARNNTQKALRQQARCDKLRDQIAHQDSLSRLARTGREQDRIAQRKRRYQTDLDKAGCG